ncbi:MAG: RDD family protein [Myxococcota bacterium]
MQAGWYYCQGDPAGTVRYWNGHQWASEPQFAQQFAQQRHEAQPPGGAHADPMLRIAARLLDAVIVFFALYAVGTVISAVAAEHAFDSVRSRGFAGIFEAVDGFGWAAFASAITGVVGSATYEIGFTITKGATPGKLLFGFYVVDQEGRTPLNAAVATVRWLPFGILMLIARLPIVAIIGAFALLVLSVAGLVMILASPKRQAPWDMLAKTHVVHRP